MYGRVMAWNKVREEKAKQETSRDRLSFLMDDKGPNANLKNTRDSQQSRSYQKRRDLQKMQKVYERSGNPVVRAPVPNGHDHHMKDCARPSEHHAGSKGGNNIINNGIYIDTNRVRNTVEENIISNVLAHEEAHRHVEKRVMRQMAHRVEDRVIRDIED